MVEIDKKIVERITSWKKSLLDMTKRNRLLWYKPYRVGSLLLTNEIFDNSIVDIFETINGLAFNDDVIEFIVNAETAKDKVNSKNLQLPISESTNPDDDEDEDEKRKTMVKNRAKALSIISKRIKLENDEKGLNIGYIAVGFLKWYERDDVNTEVKSPLIMVPIKIEQDGRYDPFRVSLNTDEEITVNPVIKKKFETDFNIVLDINFHNTEDNPQTSIQSCLNQIKDAIKNQPNWQVVDETVLDTFSFQNLVIWNDLDKNIDLIMNNPFVKVLAGAELSDEGFAFEEGEPDLEKVKSKDNVNIFEVDSSQQEAIYRARNSESFVVQGPPGTGKSQTITNIIAESLYMGKKVLFVSEKQAALDVVYHKLEKRKLSDFCLIMHNSKQRKTDVREQITKSLIMSQKRGSVTEQAMQIYEDIDKKRKELSLYSEKLHESFDDGTTPYFIIGELDRMRDVKNLAFTLPQDFDWNADYSTEVSNIFLKVSAYGESFIDNTHHFDNNLWKFYSKPFNNSTRREVQEQIGGMNNEIFDTKIEEIKTLFNDNKTKDIIKSTKQYIETLEAIPFTQANHDNISKIIDDIDNFESSKKELEKETYEFSQAIEKKKSEITTVLTDDFIKIEKAEDYYRKLTNKYSSFLSRFSSDYKNLLHILDKYATKRFKYRDWVKYFEILVSINQDKNAIENNKTKIDSIVKSANKKYSELLSELTEKNMLVLQLIKSLDFDSLHEYQNYQNIKNELLIEYKLHDFIEKVENKDISFGAFEISDIFKKRFLTLSLEMTDFDKKYSDYTRQNHDSDVDIFRKYDKQTLDISAARIKCKLVDNLPSLSSFTNEARGGEIRLLQRELKKKSRLMPTRKLIESLPVLLPQLKPCMMMSPLTISSYFGANPNWKFDIVIFDEASQVKPEYAITSIIRGGQVIVAGDSKQMPPTSFFDSIDDEDEYDDEDTQIDNLESILDEMSSAFPDVYLNWHYRSKDESLIAFSNYHFYNKRLAIFPSPIIKGEQIGIDFVYCENGLWDSKNGNKPEAEKIALIVFKHIKDHPEQSLGIVAFGKSQEYAIEEALNKLRDIQPENEWFFSDLKPEPFFIKNLENVQGDERDRVILSFGYGKDANGTFAMRFGPLAMTGGERRLNVAISRAKISMTVVASFKANEIRGVEDNPQRKLIRDFVDYAERGIVALLGDSETDIEKYQPEFDSGFEEDVFNFLKNNGFKIRTQVGASGYRIDMAVKHPKIDGRYILAIECDGASYHGSRTARDRDILRQEVLETLGWKFYRIWSTDWFHDNNNERQRLLNAILAAVSNYDNHISNTNPKEQTAEEVGLIVEDTDDNTDLELSEIYKSWKTVLKKQFGEGTFSQYNNWSNNDSWNSLYVMEHYDAIDKIFEQILKYKNGFSPEDVFREINEKVFDKNRYTEQAKCIYQRKFNQIIEQNKVEVVNNAIRIR
jgi:superfamily I DNA and/or RNA helicase/very-short-patch-repair endonuclease